MKALRPGLWAQAVLAGLLLIYGFFYHISASEFWPITISRTWFDSAHFENSLLQKPLFTFFLSLFHLLPLSDIQHLYLVKLVFAVLGTLTLFFYVEVLQILAGISLSRYKKAFFTVFLLLLSPVLFQNFFRVRSDQATFLFFVFALYFNLRGYFIRSLVCLILIPIISIKGIIFLLPGGIVLLSPYLGYIKKLSRCWRLNLALIVLAALIWAIGLNLPALSYFIDTYASNSFPNPHLKEYLTGEAFFLLGSLGIALHTWYRRDTALGPYVGAALICLFYILSVPQSYPYFIGSLCALVYLPLGVYIMRSLNGPSPALYRYLLLCVLQLGTLTAQFFSTPHALYRSSTYQFNFIKKAGHFMDAHSLHYLDGMGVLPRQKLIPCFESPDDDLANNSCRAWIREEPDVLLITQRLSALGTETFRIAEKHYIQILPNFWVHQRHQALIKPEDVQLENTPPPMLIFSF